MKPHPHHNFTPEREPSVRSEILAAIVLAAIVIACTVAVTLELAR